MVDKIYDNDFLMELYLAAKRAHFNNQYLQRSKYDKEEYLDKLFFIVAELLQCDPSDYIRFQVRALAPVRVFPSLAHLVSEKAIQRYQRHMSLKNIKRTRLWNTEGDTFTVVKTGQTYSLRGQVERKTDDDPDARFVVWLSNLDPTPTVIKPEELGNVFYTEAKYDYMYQQPTDALQHLFDLANGKT